MSIGVILYYLSWPLLWFYSPLTVRVRVIIKHNDEVLVVKNWFGSGYWQLPGGGIKAGEKPLQAANREVKEELSIKLKNLELISNEAVVYGQHGLIKRNYFVLAKIESKPAVKMSSEITDHKWIDLSSFKFPKQVSEKI